jgi:exosome complex RNA-binding protein Rrp42 (RNase PH superfamily)
MKERPSFPFEKAFITDTVNAGFRIDQRGLLDLRPIRITTGPEFGQAQVQLGKTRYQWNLI